MKTLPILNSVKVALVDNEDYERLKEFQWGLCGGGYASSGQTRDGTHVLLHHCILRASPGEEIDHIDRNLLNNQRSNLRSVTRGFNVQNRPQLNNTSGFKGVSWHVQRATWRAQTKFKGKVYHLGLFDTPQLAAEAYDRKVLALFGPDALTNKKLNLL